MITKDSHRIRCLIYMKGKAFAIMAGLALRFGYQPAHR